VGGVPGPAHGASRVPCAVKVHTEMTTYRLEGGAGGEQPAAPRPWRACYWVLVLGVESRGTSNSGVRVSTPATCSTRAVGTRGQAARALVRLSGCGSPGGWPRACSTCTPHERRVLLTCSPPPWWSPPRARPGVADFGFLREVEGSLPAPRPPPPSSPTTSRGTPALWTPTGAPAAAWGGRWTRLGQLPRFAPCSVAICSQGMQYSNRVNVSTPQPAC